MSVRHYIAVLLLGLFIGANAVMAAPSVSYLIVGGGGGSRYVASCAPSGAFGGGGGQVLSGSASITSGTPYTITVGTGGAKTTGTPAGNGLTSSAFGITALGGIGASSTKGGDSGSGFTGGGGTNGGGAGDTGGGSGGTQNNGGGGGAGTSSNISGSSLEYAHGGGGGGVFGIGASGRQEANSGDGGASGCYSNGQNGWKGIVIISTPVSSAITATGCTHSVQGSNDVWACNSTDTWTPSSPPATHGGFFKSGRVFIKSSKVFVK